MITFDKRRILDALNARINHCLSSPGGKIYIILNKPDVHMFHRYMKAIKTDSYFSVHAYNAMCSAYDKISKENVQDEISLSYLQSFDELELNQIIKALLGHNNNVILSLLLQKMQEQ